MLDGYAHPKTAGKPYKGGAPAAAALAAGDIPLGVLASSSVAPHAERNIARRQRSGGRRAALIGLSSCLRVCITV